MMNLPEESRLERHPFLIMFRKGVEILEIRVNYRTGRSTKLLVIRPSGKFARIEFSTIRSRAADRSRMARVLTGVNTRLLSAVVTYRASRYERTDPF